MQENINTEKSEKIRPVDSSGRFYGNNLAHQGHNYTSKQKIAMVGLVFFALIVFILWIVQIKESLKKPFDYGSGNSSLQQNNNQDDRTKDTDKDGLSDYDELNIYGTSPYLEDSDSDGLTDREEIMGNNNPNCAAGTDCFDGLNDTMEKKVDNQKSDIMIAPSATGGSVKDANNILEGKMDPKDLRQLLKDDGVDPRLIDAITDDELMLMYQEQLKDVNLSNQ